jgi:endonuclease YncB( thermonuclease family)
MPRHLPNASRLALIALFGLLLLDRALGQEAIVSARIVGITDGDTVKALTADNQLLRVRLSNIDAPESGQAFGQRSKQRLSELIFGRQVELHTFGLDRYGRTLAIIFVNGADVNLAQVRSGFAWVYEHYIGDAAPSVQESYHAAQLAAQQERRGLWSDTQEPVPPWLWRRAQKPVKTH